MSSQDASDVAKALAAFGAPSIRYHSFGQGAVRPSSVVIPRQAPPPAPPRPPVVLRQAEPVAVMERRLSLPPAAGSRLPASPELYAATAPMPPMPAFRRTIDPSLVAARNAAGGQSASAVETLPAALASYRPASAAPAGLTGRDVISSNPKNLREIFAILAGGPAEEAGAVNHS